MSSCLLLLNRGSGGNQRGLDAESISRSVETAFREAGHEISSIIMEPGDVDAELQRAIDKLPDMILIGGGDGTVSAAARHLGGTKIALGILPMGTFNLAARDLGVPLEMEAAIKFLTTAKIASIDVLDVSGHSCLCSTILGFYPEYSKFFESRDHGGHWWKKTYKLFSGLGSIFMKAQPLHLTWHSEEAAGKARTKFAGFVPGRYHDDAGLIPIRTDFRSGKLTAYVGTHENPLSALRGILDFSLGRLEQNAKLEIVKVSRLSLRAARRKNCRVMLDGEILQLSFPIEMKILPNHLNVMTTAEIVEETMNAAS